ncbi:MAG TPA: hypothetical protein VJ352_16800, partial [Geodermatophilus sp.]|nr:hypothetical protein [Geodermatophilus sp.]
MVLKVDVAPDLVHGDVDEGYGAESGQPFALGQPGQARLGRPGPGEEVGDDRGQVEAVEGCEDVVGCLRLPGGVVVG